MAMQLTAGYKTILKAMLLTSAVLVGGCAGYGPTNDFIGLTRGETLARLGPPNPVPANIDSAPRLDFPRGPAGKHTYAVYFNEQGVVSGYRQLLTDENFAKITAGMDESDVVDLIGVSQNTFGLARGRGYVWSYRYVTPHCHWFQVEFTAEKKVRSAGYGLPPECRAGRRGAG